MVATANALRPQVVGESVGARLELGVARPASGGVEGGPVADRVDHALEQLRDVEAHGAEKAIARVELRLEARGTVKILTLTAIPIDDYLSSLRA